MTDLLVEQLECDRAEALAEAKLALKRQFEAPHGDAGAATAAGADFNTHMARAEQAEARLKLARPKVEVVNEPLTYTREAPHSFFRDWLMPDRTPGAGERQVQHVKEMRSITQAREARALTSIRSGGFEYRVEPNTTTGTGGNFTPPLWWNEMFATAPRPKRVLADLIRACGGRFPLPSGVSSVNLPIITSGTGVAQQAPNGAVADADVTDAAGKSLVQVFAGEADVALQLLEQSPPGAHVDWAFSQDMLEDYDYRLEQALLFGLGAASNQLLGVTNVTNKVAVTYDDASPTGPEMWPFFGKAYAQIADGRGIDPQAWLWRGARWAWLAGQEDNSLRPLGLPSPFFLGDTDDTPDPITGIYGIPMFSDNAIPATLGAGANQDEAICLRPSDLLLLEGTPQLNTYREPGSGNLSVRLQLHNSAAAITNRYPSGIAVVGGTGFVIASGY